VLPALLLQIALADACLPAEPRALATWARTSRQKNDPRPELSLAAAEVYGGEGKTIEAVESLQEAAADLIAIGEGARAEDTLELSLRLARTIESRKLEVRGLIILSSIHLANGEVRGQRALLGKATALLKNVDDPQLTVQVLLHLAQIEHLLGRDEVANGLQRRSVEIARRANDRRGLSQSLNNLGASLIFRGRLREARRVHEENLALLRQIHYDRGISTSLGNLGWIDFVEGRTERAIREFREMYDIAHRLHDPHQMALSAHDLAGVLEKSGHLEEALCLALESERMGAGNQFDEYRAATKLGSIHSALGATALARVELERAITLEERMRADAPVGDLDREAAFAQRLDPYDALAHLLAKSKDAAALLELGERMKARVLTDVLAHGDAPQAQVTRAERDRLARLRRAATRDNAAEGTAAIAYAQARNELFALRPELDVRAGHVAPFEASEVRRLLDERTAAVEYIVTEHGIYAVVCRRNSQRIVTLRRGNAEALREAIAQRDFNYRPAGAALYQSLFAPLARHLAGVQRLLIIPDRELWGVPFAALIDGDGRFLIERFVITYAPSLAALREMQALRRSRAPHPPRTLALVDPSLPGASWETAGATICSTKKALLRLAPKYDILHIATHAAADEASPLDSYIAVHGERLEAWEVMNLHLRSELVILSACETGRGRILGGEGTIGLSWSFFAAGATRQIISQWPIDSVATADLMLAFHRAYRPGRDAGAALREAQLQLLRDKPHPFYWAAFLVIGA
jgi:CHAT domain-containing protein